MAKVTGSMVAVSVRLAQTLVPPAAAEDGVAVATSEPPPIARALNRTEITPTIRWRSSMLLSLLNLESALALPGEDVVLMGRVRETCRSNVAG